MSVWRGATPPILASQSAARRTLLANAGVACEAIPADLDERGIQERSGLREPGAIATLLAREKALAVSGRHPGRIVLSADQTLALGERLFSKPDGRAAAHAQLRALSGATHTLHSAVAVVVDGAVAFSHVADARMTMRALSDDALSAYLDAAGDAVRKSVGCYQLEGLGVHLFSAIDGDHFTILGLPLVPLLAFLRGEKLLAF